jgi:hypothetical protein
MKAGAVDAEGPYPLSRSELVEFRYDRRCGHRSTPYGRTEYFVKAPPAWANEFGPSAA